MRTIRSSEIGAYLYCQRAWWYAKRGHSPENLSELAAGTELHAQHGRSVLTSGLLLTLAYGSSLVAVILLAAYLVNQIF
jgi:CRISPR/Cas system-associated exonuclease Cas4 (RecB family)